MFRLIYLLLITLLTPLVLSADYVQPSERHRRGRLGKPLDLEKEMSPSEYRATGVEKLSPQRRRNLEEWINQWVRRQVEAETVNIYRISHIEHKAGTITLDDGSIWRTRRFSESIVRSWREDHRVRVAAGTPYRLENLSLRRTIDVDLLSGPGVDKRPAYHRIESVSIRGGLITLDDVSVWKVHLVDKGKMRLWIAGQEVEVIGDWAKRSRMDLYNRSLRQRVQVNGIRTPKVKYETVETEREEIEFEELPLEEKESSEDLHEDG